MRNPQKCVTSRNQCIGPSQRTIASVNPASSHRQTIRAASTPKPIRDQPALRLSFREVALSLQSSAVRRYLPAGRIGSPRAHEPSVASSSPAPGAQPRAVAQSRLALGSREKQRGRCAIRQTPSRGRRPRILQPPHPARLGEA